jgi:signal transduction histidine kinase
VEAAPRDRESVFTLVHPDDRVALMEAVEGCAAAGEPFNVQHRIVRPDGEIRWMDARGRVIRDETTKTSLMMFGTAQDITERKQLERLRREFVSGISHDLRTPLTSIKGFAALLRTAGAELTESERADYTLRVERNAHELESLIGQLLDYSRLEAGYANLLPEPLAVGRLVRSSVEALEPVLAAHDVSVSVDEQITVHADADGLRRVLRNLIENAAKFAPRQTSIWIGAHYAGEEVVISVRDEGPGIPVDQRELVFDAFYRGSPSSARGTGLGLAVAKRYVELGGGHIWIDGEPGRGTTMSFTLPRAGRAAGGRAA